MGYSDRGGRAVLRTQRTAAGDRAGAQHAAGYRDGVLTAHVVRIPVLRIHRLGTGGGARDRRSRARCPRPRDPACPRVHLRVRKRSVGARGGRQQHRQRAGSEQRGERVRMGVCGRGRGAQRRGAVPATARRVRRRGRSALAARVGSGAGRARGLCMCREGGCILRAMYCT